MTAACGFGLYIHWPFCQAKCPYCDFNSHVADTIDQRVWQKAYAAEIERVREDLPDRTLSTIYFGGGTPSLMSPDTVDFVITKARAAWPFRNDVEITLEANPTSVEAAGFSGFADAGVNRVSVGVQSLRDQDLKRLGRLHTSDDARRALAFANQHFDRVSFDLIYARQDQALADWETELNEALSLTSGHLSLYQLTIEPGTAFGDRFDKGGLAGLPGDDVAADMYELTQELTSSRGLPAYEISNHCIPGNESRHNMIYWTGGNWLGVGPGAHGRFTSNGQRIATETHLGPVQWLDAVRKGCGETRRHILASHPAKEERLMMGLRLSQGIPVSDFAEYTNKFNYLTDIGMLDSDGTHLRATAQGKLVLNAVIRELLA